MFLSEVFQKFSILFAKSFLSYPVETIRQFRTRIVSSLLKYLDRTPSCYEQDGGICVWVTGNLCGKQLISKMP